MKIELSLFGALRDLDPDARIVLELPEGARVADLRTALRVHADAHWPGFGPGLLVKSAFASEQAVLRDSESLPADGRIAVLPPVSGG